MSSTIAANIRRIRKAKKLTQAQVAERLGVKQPAVHKWEKLVDRPDLETLLRIAVALEVEVHELLVGVPGSEYGGTLALARQGFTALHEDWLPAIQQGVLSGEMSREDALRALRSVDEGVRRFVEKMTGEKIQSAFSEPIDRPQTTDADSIGEAPMTTKVLKTPEILTIGRHVRQSQVPPQPDEAAPPPHETGVDMRPGDEGLWSHVDGAWKMLRNDKERRAFVRHVRRFFEAPPAAQDRPRKKVIR